MKADLIQEKIPLLLNKVSLKIAGTVINLQNEVLKRLMKIWK